MSDNKQNSIEYLAHELSSLSFDYLVGQVSNKEHGERYDKIFEQAKAMYNTEMIEFAQLHVKAALDAAAESIECYPSEQVAIITSYPLTNIK